MHKKVLFFISLVIMGFVAACAPANLDITPSPVPTDTPTETPRPTITPTVEFTPTPDVEAVDVEISGVSNEEFVNLIVAGMPTRVSGGAVQWLYDQTRDPETVRNVQDGTARKVFLTDPTGGQANLTFGVFDSPEAAMAHYERIAPLRNNIANGAPRENFPMPNAFGQGTYGSYAILQLDNLFLEISVEAFSSTSGDPLPGLVRSALAIVEEGIALAAEGPIELDPLILSLAEALPDPLQDWERGETIPVLVENGEAIEIVYQKGTQTINVYLGKFSTPSNAYSAYGNLISRGTVAVQVNEVVIAVRGGDISLSLLSDVIQAIEPVLAN